MILRRRALECSVARDQPHVAGHECPVGTRIERLHASRQRVRPQPIVGIQEHNQVSARRAQSSVSCPRCATVLLVQVLCCRILRRDARGVVRGSVVDDDHFNRCVRLAERALDGFAEESRLVVAGNHDRHERRRLLWRDHGRSDRDQDTVRASL